MSSDIQSFNSVEAAQILGVNVSTIKRWTDEGKLECIKTVGGHRKFLMEHLASFLEKNKKKTSKVNLFPLENKSDLQISHNIMKGDFNFLVDYVQKNALACNRDRVQKALSGLYLGQYPLYVIYDKLITPALHHLGNLWSEEKISAIEEHFASQTLRDSIVRLQGIIRIPARKVGKAMCLNFSSELHDIALKMVDHVLESRGDKVLFSGQITPIINIEHVFESLQPQRVYISSTIVENVASVQEEFDQICEVAAVHRIKVFVGGIGFNTIEIRNPELVTRLTTFEEVYNS
jgi:excisionase family DNA binding protein